MKKAILIFPLLFAAVFVVLLLTNIDFGNTLKTIYYALTAVVSVWAVIRVLARAVRLRDRDALFTGALGLGLLAVSFVYEVVFALLASAKTVLDISDFSDACSYLFFLSAVTLLLLPPYRTERVIRIGVSVVSVAIIIFTIYSVLTDNGKLLYMIVIVTAVLCTVLSVYLLYQTRRLRLLKPAGFFAVSILFLGVLDIAVYTALFTDAGRLYTILTALYLPAPVWIAEGLLRLRGGEENG